MEKTLTILCWSPNCVSCRWWVRKKSDETEGSAAAQYLFSYILFTVWTWTLWPALKKWIKLSNWNKRTRRKAKNTVITFKSKWPLTEKQIPWHKKKPSSCLSIIQMGPTILHLNTRRSQSSVCLTSKQLHSRKCSFYYYFLFELYKPYR